MFRNIVCLTFFLVLIACALPAHAANDCSFPFGSGGNRVIFCVSSTGNIIYIQTPINHLQTGVNEGYGLCQESPAVEYHDYGFEFTGNWNPATVVSHTTTSVKIARSTSDGNWTLTQTLTQTTTSSITVVMALKNNQAVSRTAYLVRYADVNADGQSINAFGATVNSAFAWSYNPPSNNPPYYGLQLQNVGTPPFGFWRGYAQTVPSGPNACAFAFNDSGGYFLGNGSVVMAYVGAVPAHGTRTVTLTYRGL